jgi:hypothetical protein
MGEMSRGNLYSTLHAIVAAYREKDLPRLIDLAYPDVAEFLRSLAAEGEDSPARQAFFAVGHAPLSDWVGPPGEVRYQEPPPEEAARHPELAGCVLANVALLDLPDGGVLSISLLRQGAAWHFLSVQTQTREAFTAGGKLREDLTA